GSRGDQRLAEEIVEFLDEQPGAPIGHFVRAAGSGDRTCPSDRLQQRDLARPEPALAVEVETNGQPRRHAGSERSARMGIIPIEFARSAERGTRLQVPRVDAANRRHLAVIADYEYFVR